jgi:uncharacterized protein YggE
MRLSCSLLLALLSLSGCFEKAADPRGVGRDEVLLQVAAIGRADTRPDEARFTAGVQTIAATAAAASAGNNAVMDRVGAALQRLGVKPDDIQTRQITLARMDYGPERGRFQANNMVEVRVRNLARTGDAIAATTEAGANVLSGPNMTISDPEAASRSAYAQAYKAARARAETYASAAGLKVARVLAIRDGGGGPSPYAYPEEGVAVQTAAPPPIARTSAPFQAGMSTSQVQVRADFALGPK